MAQARLSTENRSQRIARRFSPSRASLSRSALGERRSFAAISLSENLTSPSRMAATLSVDRPVVEVFLAEVEQWLYITILDNGPGIPASVRETLFDPFVTMGKPNGTGLGLTLARRIAEEHGGSVLLDESIPKKTVFTLSLVKNRLLT